LKSSSSYAGLPARDATDIPSGAFAEPLPRVYRFARFQYTSGKARRMRKCHVESKSVNAQESE